MRGALQRTYWIKAPLMRAAAGSGAPLGRPRCLAGAGQGKVTAVQWSYWFSEPALDGRGSDAMR